MSRVRSLAPNGHVGRPTTRVRSHAARWTQAMSPSPPSVGTRLDSPMCAANHGAAGGRPAEAITMWSSPSMMATHEASSSCRVRDARAESTSWVALASRMAAAVS